uniref:carbon starvation CstA family protein n=1 Tax=Alistipes sp. TaxID=1872444 RepID=UPI0040571298
MITFLICLTLLVAAYFTYGRYLDRVCEIDAKNPVPSTTHYDGVDYLPLPRWKIFLIQLLNIAGLGPIFGAVLGAAFGPVAFLWITLGGIFLGAMHDMISGVISVKQGGMSLPEIVGDLLGSQVKTFMRIFSVLLMVLVGAVFLSQPAALIDNALDIPALEAISIGRYTMMMAVILGVILIYYIMATLLPIDKIIGKFYPIFGIALLVMALGILWVLLTQSENYPIPELTSFKNMIANAEKMPIFPMLFTTIACGAISGFHATQSPLMARCLTNEKQCRSIFYGAMIAESIIALIWAAIGMAFWGGVEGLNAAIAANGGNAALLIDAIANQTLGRVVATLVIFGVIACAITSGDTAFRSARLIVADFMGLEQKSLKKRIWVCLPLFALALVIILGLPFQTIWSYFAWSNQLLAAITLWAITAWLARHKKSLWIGLLPALFMTFICSSYIFISPLMFGMQSRLWAYLLGGALSVVILLYMYPKIKPSCSPEKQ